MLKLIPAIRNHRSERGQLLVPFALIIFSLVAICGLAVDVGMLFVTRAQLTRAVDAAALAAVTDLPDTDLASTRANTYLDRNEPDATMDDVSFPAQGQVRIEASKSVKLHFVSLLPGIGDSVEVSSHAVAGAGVPMDIVFVLDDTGTMQQGCNSAQSNSGCPIKGERDGALAMLDILGVNTSSETVKVGVMPFRGCFTATSTSGAAGKCIHDNATSPVTNDPSGLQAVMANLTGNGGSGTNVCRGLQLGEQVLNGTDSRANARKILIVLTDGDNFRNNSSNYDAITEDWPGAGTPSGYDCDWPSNNSTNTQDSTTNTLANQLASSGIEIYVVGYGVDGSPNNNLCNPAQVGSGNHDRNLAKCIATSSAGSNDHYFEAPTPEDLPGIFRVIAQRLAQRLVE